MRPRRSSPLRALPLLLLLAAGPACRRGHVATTLDAYSYGVASRLDAFEAKLERGGPRLVDDAVMPDAARPLRRLELVPRELDGEEGIAALAAAVASSVDEIAHRRLLVTELRAERRSAEAHILLEVLGSREGLPVTARAEVELSLRREEGGAWAITRARLVRGELLGQGSRRLVDRAAAWGIAAPHRLRRPEQRSIALPGVHSAPGCALGDLDGDGFPDLVVADGGRDHLYMNAGGKRFEERSREAGFAEDGEGRGVLMFDQEGDGDLDVLVVNADRDPDLYVNDGHARFVERARELGIAGVVQGTSAAAADVDGDGALDLFVASYGEAEVEWPSLTGRNGRPDLLFVRRGERFVEMAAAASADEMGWGLAASFADRDGDGDQDLYVANDFGRNAMLDNVSRPGHPAFTDATGRTDTADPGYGMSVAWGDYDGDLDLDLYVADYFWEGRFVLASPDFPMPPFPGPILRPFVVKRLLAMTRGNALLEARGKRYVRVSEERGVAEAGWCWASGFWDPDDDGDLDILAANGWISGPDPTDVALEFWTGMVSTFDQMERHQGFLDIGERSLHGRERPRLFLNLSDDGAGPRFAEAAWAWGIAPTMDGRSLAFGDVDRDGDQDAVVTTHMAAPALLINDGAPAASWIELALDGAASGVGARVTIAAGPRRLLRHLAAGDTFLSSSEPVVHAGLGSHEGLVTVEVQWPDGRRTQHVDLAPRRRYRLVEASEAALLDDPARSAGP